MKKNRKKIIGIIAVFSITAIAAGLVHHNVAQAMIVRSQLDKALQTKDYKEAASIYNSIDKDVFLKNTIKMEAKETNLVKNDLNELVRKYKDNNITFDECLQEISDIRKLNLVNDNYMKSTKNHLYQLNSDKQALNSSQRLYSRGNYTEALDELRNFKNSCEEYKKRKSELKNKIDIGITDSISNDIQKYIVNMDVGDAIRKLYENKDYLNKKYLSEKKLEIENEIHRLKSEQQKIQGQVSETKYLILVDLEHQNTEIYVKQYSQWKLNKLFLASTGSDGHSTPKGVFSVSDKGEWFYNSKYGEGAKYWVRFNNSYLFHSLPMDKNQNITDHTLGKAASHGCVRMSVSEAKWVFDNIPRDTKAIVE